MQSIIYISRRTTPPAEAICEVDEIVLNARSRNVALGVTGALIATPVHFAQMLEGPTVALDAVMSSIHEDTRHRITHLVKLESTTHREFAGWSLAYHGESHMVWKMLADAIAASDFELQTHIETIKALMQMLA